MKDRLPAVLVAAVLGVAVLMGCRVAFSVFLPFYIGLEKGLSGPPGGAAETSAISPAPAGGADHDVATLPVRSGGWAPSARSGSMDRAAKPSADVWSTTVAALEGDGRATWATVEHPASWHVASQGGRLALSSASEDQIAQWYGRTTTNTWGVLYMYLSQDEGEVGQFEGDNVAMDEVDVGGRPSRRARVEDAEGRLDVSMVIDTGDGYVVLSSQIAGAPGARAEALRETLDTIMDSLTLTSEAPAPLTKSP